MKKTHIGERETWWLPLLIAWAIACGGCSEGSRRTTFDPTIHPELRGDIHADKKIYDLGEPIVVTYRLTNISERWIEDKVVDGSRDPGIPFQGYSFDAIAIERVSQSPGLQEDLDGPGYKEAGRKKTHLELLKAGTALEGAMKIGPRDKTVFAQNVFVADRPGHYHLTLELRWADGKKIPFRPESIKVQEKKPEPSPIDLALQKGIDDLGNPDPTIKGEARQYLEETGERAAPRLVQLLAGDDLDQAAEAMNLLIKLKKRAIGALEDGISHPDKKLRLRIVAVLQSMGEVDAILPLCMLADRDPDPEVREEAIRAIAEIFDNRLVIPFMILKFEDPEARIRTLVLEVIRARVDRNDLKKQDLEFEVDAPEEVRKRQILKWKDWWREKDLQAFKRFEQMYAKDGK